MFLTYQNKICYKCFSLNFIGFLFIWGIMIMLITTLICIFKKEKDQQLEDNHVELSIVQNYKLLWDILKLPNIRLLLIALITMKVNRNKNQCYLNQ